MSLNSQPLFDRNERPDYIPRIGAVHDLCGYGKCSLGVAIPVISAGGCDVCPVPTGLFSSHTAFPFWSMHDTTEMLPAYLDAWEKVDIELDAVYSGFLGAPEQVESIQRLYHTHPNALRIVDPVMGDNGKMYPTYTKELCDSMANLADGADILTPNLTEASLILGIDYPSQNISNEEVESIINMLRNRGAKNVVIKGVDREDGYIRNYVAGRNTPLTELIEEKLPFMLHGTGDLFCSCLTAAIMAGKDVVTSVDFAGKFVHDAMIVTLEQPNFMSRGVSFEPLLGKVAALLS